MDPVTKLNVIKERLTTKTRENAENWANVKTRLEQIKKSIDAFRQQQQQPLDNSRQLFQDSSEKISQELVILNKQYQMVIAENERLKEGKQLPANTEERTRFGEQTARLFALEKENTLLKADITSETDKITKLIDSIDSNMGETIAQVTQIESALFPPRRGGYSKTKKRKNYKKRRSRRHRK